MKKVLICVTSHDKLGNTGKKTGYHLTEVTHPFFKLKEAGFEIDFMSPKGGKAPMDPNSYKLDDPENKKFVETPELMNQLDHTLKPSEIDPESYAGIFFPGGHGTMWDFPDNPELANIIYQIYENGGVVGAICHGPAALVNVMLSTGRYLVSHKKMACFSNEEEKEVSADKIVPFLLQSKLEEQDAKVKPGSNWSDTVIVDERLITGQNPQSASHLGEVMAKLLKSSND